MNNKGYNKEQNRYIEGKDFRAILQVIDVQSPKLSSGGTWTYSSANYYDITLCKFVDFNEQSKPDFQLYSIQVAKGISTWKKWEKVIKEFNKGNVPELTGNFHCFKADGKRHMLSAKSKFSMTDIQTHTAFEQGLEKWLNVELPVEPDIIHADSF
jgi:hypothetical protein